MSDTGWNGKTPAEIIADVNAIIASLPPMPDALEMRVAPSVAFFDWRREASDQIERAFRRKEPWAVMPMLDRIAERAAAEMFAFSRGSMP